MTIAQHFECWGPVSNGSRVRVTDGCELCQLSSGFQSSVSRTASAGVGFSQHSKCWAIVTRPLRGLEGKGPFVQSRFHAVSTVGGTGKAHGTNTSFPKWARSSINSWARLASDKGML